MFSNYNNTFEQTSNSFMFENNDDSGRWNSLFGDASRKNEEQGKQHTSFTIDDIINALVIARDARDVAERKMTEIISVTEQPILDISKTRTFYMVVHKVFANNENVFSKDTPLYQNEKKAVMELQRLLMKNPNIEYEIRQMRWLNEDEEVPQLEQLDTIGNDKDTSSSECSCEHDADFARRYEL